MRKEKIITIVGARPQFVKMATLSPCLRKSFKEVVIHTGQHYDKKMSSVFFSELKIPKPQYNLGIRVANQGEQTARMISGIEKVLIKEKPRLVIVYGDTNSTLAGALAAAKLNISVAHVEAGLRSFNRSMPEETNRVIVDHISNLLFCPTQNAVLNLKAEGIDSGIYLVGDLTQDSIFRYLRQAEARSEVLIRLGISRGKYYLFTMHRAGNTLDIACLKKVLAVIDNLDFPVIFPVHPRTKEFLRSSFKPKKSLIFKQPVAYLDMLVLEKNARAIITDSGGIQKEAYILKVPCFTIREETEWKETLRGGCNRLINIETADLASQLRKINRSAGSFISNIYGHCNTAEKIEKAIADYIET